MKKRSKNWFADAVQKAAEALAQSDSSGMTLEEQIEDDAEYGYFDDAMDYSPPEPIELEPAQIAPALFHGMRYCFLCHRDYDDYCDFYHVDHEIYRARLSDKRIARKISEVFPVIEELRHAKGNKVREWYWQYLGEGCGLLVHEDIIDAYRLKTGIDDEPLDWQPDEAWETICENPLDKYMLDDSRTSRGQKGVWVYLGDKSERYVLGQPGKKNLLVLGVNPSSAEPGADDPTIRMVREISRKEGYDGWIMVNLHPQRAPKPNQLIEKELWRENNLKALDAVRRSFRIDKVWCAWGASIDKPGNRFLYRSLKEIHELLKDGVSWMRYGDLTKNGHPHHPLYSSSEGKFLPFDVEGYLSNHG